MGHHARSTSSTSPSARSWASDRRPFKTREGDVVGLESLLDEATADGAQGRRREQPRARSRRAASASPRSSGLGAIKYADLCQNRISDYVFDWQKMMAMNGNTATYLQYAYARIQSIFRKGGFVTGGDPPRSARRSA